MVPQWCRPEARLSYPTDFIHERRGLRLALDGVQALPAVVAAITVTTTATVADSRSIP